MSNSELKVMTTEKQGYCKKHVPFPVKEIENFNGQTRLVGNCQKCVEEERDKKIQKRKEHTIKGLMKYAGLPKRFEDKTYNDFNTGDDKRKMHVKDAVIKYSNLFDSRKKNIPSGVWTGPPGTGKSLLACCTAKEIINKTCCSYEMNELIEREELKTHECFAHYTTEYALLRRIKNTWGKNATESEEFVIENYCEPDLLIIDEVGVSFNSESDRILLYQLINGRYERCLPTVLISNLNKDDLTEYCGLRIMDRLRENGGIQLIFNWGSHRK